MSVNLSPETQALVEEHLRRGGYATADDLVRVALRVLSQVEAEPISDEEAEEIRESLSQFERGEVVEWDELSARLRAKYLGE